LTWKDFQEKVNGELIGNLGNLVNRTLSFVTRYYEGRVPKSGGDPVFWKALGEREAGIAEKLERAELRDAFREIFELSSFANKTFQDAQPWKKRVEDPGAAEAVIGDLCRVVRDIAVMIAPYLPASAERIASFFGLTLKNLSWADIGRPGGLDRVVFSEVLFSKLEDALVEGLREKYSGNQRERASAEAEAGKKPRTILNAIKIKTTMHRKTSAAVNRPFLFFTALPLFGIIP
jgi:methionyl-tRNA synthetase